MSRTGIHKMIINAEIKSMDSAQRALYAAAEYRLRREFFGAILPEKFERQQCCKKYLHGDIPHRHCRSRRHIANIFQCSIRQISRWTRDEQDWVMLMGLDPQLDEYFDLRYRRN
jgi:hypothetical protein